MAKASTSTVATKINSDPSSNLTTSPTADTKPAETVKDVFEGLKYDELLEIHKSKSAMIRHLATLTQDRGKIARFMGIKYQFVRNVLVTPIGKKSD